jgi:hypothetical protein
MNNKIVMFVLLFFSLAYTSCLEKREVFVNIEQPTRKALHNDNIKVIANEKEIYSDKITYSNTVPRYETICFVYPKNKAEINLKVKIRDTVFNYSLKYPEDKYIIVAPYLKEDSIKMGYKSQKEKFTFH